jgi:hypothetical protein
MLRNELTERLTGIKTILDTIVASEHNSVVTPARECIKQLLEDIEGEGVLDVQAPPEVAKHMDLKTFTQDQSAQSRRQAAIKIVSIPGGERLIIENQAILLSGMCVLLTNSGSVAQAAQNALDQIACCHDYLNATVRGR